MAKGDPLLSPWVYEASDYVGLKIKITVNFNNASRALQNSIVHRDDGCRYTKVVFDDPGDGVKSKRIIAPSDAEGDRTYGAAAMATRGLNTIEDVLAIQITAEP